MGVGVSECVWGREEGWFGFIGFDFAEDLQVLLVAAVAEPFRMLLHNLMLNKFFPSIEHGTSPLMHYMAKLNANQATLLYLEADFFFFSPSWSLAISLCRFQRFRSISFITFCPSFS